MIELKLGMREETLKYYSYNGMIGNLTFHKFILHDFCWIDTPNTAFKGKYSKFSQKVMSDFSFYPPD